MFIVDSQIHIWGHDSPTRPRPPGNYQVGRPAAIHRPTPLEKDEILREMDAAGVDRVILVPASWEAYRNDLALEAATKHPQRFAVMGRLPLDLAGSRETLETWKSQPGMLGVRLTFNHEHERTWLDDGTADWFWPAAERLDLPVMVLVMSTRQLSAIGKVARQHPNLRLSLDSFGVRSSEELATGLDEAMAPVLELAAYPNVAVKAGALPAKCSDPFPFRSMHEPVRRLVDAFGVQRVFWASDLTQLLRGRCSYRAAVTMVTEGMAFLSDRDKEWIMGRSVSDWLNWPCGQS